MKRSEMVKLMAEHLISNCNIYGGDQEERDEVRKSTKMGRLKFANECLKACEDAGMLPPEQFRPVDYVDPTHEWDKE